MQVEVGNESAVCVCVCRCSYEVETSSALITQTQHPSQGHVIFKTHHCKKHCKKKKKKQSWHRPKENKTTKTETRKCADGEREGPRGGRLIYIRAETLPNGKFPSMSGTVWQAVHVRLPQ